MRINLHSGAFAKTIPLLVIVPLTLWAQIAEISTLRVKGSIDPQLLVGDANNDGKNELVALTDSAVTVYSYDFGTQQFVKIWERLITVYGYHATGFIGDTDNDGKNELIVREGYYLSGTLTVYKYQQSASGWVVKWTTSKPSAADPWHTCVGDADNDGKNELIVGSGYSGDGGRKIEIYRYDSLSFGYSRVWETSIGKDILSVRVSDTDNDGKNELLVGDGYWNPDVRIYKYSSSQGYQIVCIYSIGEAVGFRTVAGDVDNDGKNEILAAIHIGWGTTRDCQILENSGSPSSYSKTWSWGGNKSTAFPIIADVLAKGKNQFLFATQESDSNAIYVYENQNQQYVPVNQLRVAYYVTDMLVGDPFNAGINTLAVAGNDGLIHFYGPPLKPPVLTSPLNGETIVPTQLMLNWYVPVGAGGSLLQLALDPLFLVPYLDVYLGGSGTKSYSLPGLSNGTRYFWRVLNNGLRTGSSDTWSFTTPIGPLPYVEVFSSNPSFVPASPTSGSSDTYMWDASQGIYTVYLTETVSLVNKFALSPLFAKMQSSNFVIQVDIRPVKVSFGMGIGMILYDADVGLGQSIDQGKYLWIHHSGSDHPIFYLCDGNGHNYSSTAPTLGTWYTVKITYTSSSGKADLSITNRTTGGVFYQQNGVTFNPVSFNRIGFGAATSSGDGTTAEMQYDNVTVAPQQVLVAPILLLPTNGATNVSSNPTLNWNGSSGATSYGLQVSTSASFSSIIYSQQGITGTSQQVTGLGTNTTYYWRVNATNASGTSSYSNIWSFTTVIGAPAAPTLSSPASGAAVTGNTITFAWNSATGAISYRLQISTSPSFATTILDLSGIAGSSITYTGLAANTVYYWRVNASNSAGTTSFSSVWSFTTAGTTDVESINVGIPSEFSLSQNFPNPFNPTSTIEFQIPRESHVRLSVFDIMGDELSILVNEIKAPGSYRVRVDGTAFAAGTYICRMVAGTFVQSRKLLLIK
jgi:hypothetical protein